MAISETDMKEAYSYSSENSELFQIIPHHVFEGEAPNNIHKACRLVQTYSG